MLNVTIVSFVTANGDDLPTTEEFTYLGSTVTCNGGAGSDIQKQFSKATKAFSMLNNVWRPFQCSSEALEWPPDIVQHTERLCESCVFSTILYDSGCWRTTKSGSSSCPFSTP